MRINETYNEVFSDTLISFRPLGGANCGRGESINAMLPTGGGAKLSYSDGAAGDVWSGGTVGSPSASL